MLKNETQQGYLYAVLAFLMWGMAPIYFKQIESIAALEILTHRVIWSVLFLILILFAVKQWHQIQHVIKKPKLLGMLCISSTLLGFNWGLFIWAVNNDHMLDASLGYYINPLLNVLLGVVFLSERLRKWQIIAVIIASLGVLLQVIAYGSFPVVAFALASSFAIYGLLRKKMPVESLPGLLIEALILMPFAILYWYLTPATVSSDMFSNEALLNILLISAGVVTTLPLLCFIGAAKRLPYSTLGLFQYLGPSIMFTLAVTLYGEVFSVERAVTFACIWGALALYSWDSLRASKNQ
ncbi:EamA family transporter RarD [Pseudoalteromonas phenolica]|uniref:Chloramphenicol DMT transporter permease n=1 Tax=Pseudoalteromonas phenolica TaxID=161398 RepID=A0A0S2K4V3_9GAMM|nr:EamA family transporter RarD [Pseudoalteromonas phenolica]ALO43372.1 Chloramphenicol DMT transporter permease [Pseudoalteromonas phenolica]MBE0355469.1 chloramphenicol-sensitive protein RarD [Pseudoalteromonas phenolica O-BC30]RXE99563.1 EamA family transporter RarD [Pseudoalteromonas phenolica O-BC30]